MNTPIKAEELDELKVQIHENICKRMTDTYRRKNSDYGDSFGRSYEKYGSISALTRISDKFNRLESLMLGKEQKVQDEKVEDTLADMASYCIMTIMEVNYPQTKDLWALDVEKSSCIGHDNNSHLSWVFTYPHVAMFRAALTSASATLPQCAQRKCLPCLMPM